MRIRGQRVYSSHIRQVLTPFSLVQKYILNGGWIKVGRGKLPSGAIKIPVGGSAAIGIPVSGGFFFYEDEPNGHKIHRNPGCHQCQKWARSPGKGGGKWYYCPTRNDAVAVGNIRVGVGNYRDCWAKGCK